MLLRSAEVGEVRADVRVAAGRVTAVGSLSPGAGEEVLDAGGGALLPGLHDHHVHLLAAAAAASSVDCGPGACRDLDGLARQVARAPGSGGWIRGTGYHESVAGPLDRWVLDRVSADRPLRIQHRGGALWMLNSAALALVLSHAGPGAEGVETDTEGRFTGRLWRRDDMVRAATASSRAAPDLAALGSRMRAFGLTGATDATPDLDVSAVDVLAGAAASGALPARLHLLGAAALDEPQRAAGLSLGPVKLLLPDHVPTVPEDLATRIREAHRAGRPVAVHCVTREALVVTLVALETAGVVAGDRIEHGAVAPPDLAARVARRGVRVVTQPCLPAERGDEYLADVDAEDRDHLYPYAALLAAGIRVAPSSDAPYASLDPWAAMSAAASRRAPSGARVGADEPVPAAVVLAGYLSRPEDPGGAPRRVAVGEPADLCLLHVPLREALAAPSADLVRLVLTGDGREPDG